MKRLFLALALAAALPIAAQTTTTDKPAAKPSEKGEQKTEKKTDVPAPEKKASSAEEKKPAEETKSAEEKKPTEGKNTTDEKTAAKEKKSADTKLAEEKKEKPSPSDVFPDISHERVDYWVAAFSKMHDYHKKIAAGFQRKAKYQDLLERKLRKKGMPQNLIYLAFEESAFNCEAKSREKANGIWQLTPATARLYGLKVNKKVDDRMQVEKETDAALRFLNHLHNRFGSWYLAAAAYDAGENRVARLMRKHFKREHGRDRDYYKIWNDLPGETRDYVPAIVALERIGKNPAKYGF